LKKRRKNGSRNSGLSSSGERVTTEMLTTAGVTSLTSGASVGSVWLPAGTCASAGAPSAAQTIVKINANCLT
jgi:hypothetical protein